MMDYYLLAARSSYQDSLKVLEADIHHANMLAASMPRAKGSSCLQMKLVYNQFAPIIWYLLQWLDCSCTCLLPAYLSLFHLVIYQVSSDGMSTSSSIGRIATIREFYAVILPSLEQLSTSDLDTNEEMFKFDAFVQKRLEDSKRKESDVDLERDDECGICLEPCTRMVLPNCCHGMCINCYRDWNMRSESCPFCRGSIKRVASGDLWVLTCNKDVVDAETVSKEDMLRFYLYINNLPKDAAPEDMFLVYYEYLI